MEFVRTVDIPRSVDNFRFFASSVLHHTTDCSQMDHMGCVNYTLRCPVGVGEGPPCVCACVCVRVLGVRDVLVCVLQLTEVECVVLPSPQCA